MTRNKKIGLFIIALGSMFLIGYYIGYQQGIAKANLFFGEYLKECVCGILI